MALKHYTGSVKPVSTVWRCPTCGGEVVTPLEQGCPNCAAGRDAKAGADAKAAAQSASRVEFPAPPSFIAWWDLQKAEALKLNGYEIARLAYQAGYDVGRVQGTPVHRVQGPSVDTDTAEGGWRLDLVTAQMESQPMDDRTHQTILAALAFYRDNQLAYGAIPGQLSAEETTQLITKLTPQEEVPV